MRKFLVLVMVLFLNVSSAFATKIPDEITNYIKKDFPKAEIRFDGLITIDNTLYLPLFPAKIIKPQNISIKKTAPQNKNLKNLPDIVVFNNDFTLLKVIDEKDGKRTVLYQSEPCLEVRTGLLPQDMLVPKGLIIPDNIKSIVGSLRIATEQETGLKVNSEFVEVQKVTNTTVKKDLVSTVPQLKNKNMYLITCKSKNIHVVPTETSKPEYALSMNSIPIDLKSYNDRFLMITNFDIPELNVISLADEAVIKTFEFDAQPEEIVMDLINKKAYVTVPETSSIYVIDLATMLMKQKIQVNGRCTKLYLTPDSSKLIYVDKKTNDVWAVELNNDFLIKEIGIFPNISSIAYSQNKIYLASRTKNKVAIVDYATMLSVQELDVAPKPVDLFLFNNNLYILSAQNSVLQVLNTQNDKVSSIINLDTNSFPTKITRINNTNLAIITGARGGKYSILDLGKKQIIKTSKIDVPVSKIVITEKVKKINK